MSDLHVSLERIPSGLPLILLILLSLPLTSPPITPLKHVDDILLPRSSSFTCLPSTRSCPGCLSFVLLLVVLGSCLTMIPIPKDSYKTPHISRSTPSSRVPVPSPRTCSPYVTTEVRSPILGLSLEVRGDSLRIGGGLTYCRVHDSAFGPWRLLCRSEWFKRFD
jgi:hypothetical protein